MAFIDKLVIFCLVAYAAGAPAEDLIVNLPGLGYPINFNQYSGYLSGSTNASNAINLHYWFVESQDDPESDPVLLWLNGGPGCSSLMGMLTELGPFRVNEDGATLKDNPYAWNKVANIIFLESPDCVGFSYGDSSCQAGDDQVADMNYLALQDFFLNKFPEYFDNDFYVTGESYAGIYIPTLSVRIVDGLGTFPLNFIGYAIGNGILSYTNNDNSLLFYGYYHALFGQLLWNDLVNNCCVNQIESPQSCDFSAGDQSVACQNSVAEGNNIIYSGGLNHYNLYGTCDGSSSSESQSTEYSLALQNLFRKHTKVSRPQPFSEVPCLDNSNEELYLNRIDVRAALHIPTLVQDWTVCSTKVAARYSRQYDEVRSLLTYLLPQVRGLVFNGDTDMAVNFLGNDWDIAIMNMTVTDSRKKWIVNDDVAGYVTRYENFDFLTVRGAGHMVPQYRPEEALHMITSFINDDPY